ncbi:MAG: UDP-N-acetylmuramate--L-alanine ligase [Calditrichaeota bacterium]|nr:UDP-N-acetylmuramate--L-alanine ligase [Calditrichota bacterium]MBT7789201.1 UDP-N-acetylmuramate--L-alanine ligase [Calditrichota bacterium]
MNQLILKRFRRAWFIGIGGSGMSGLAEVMLASGFEVAGSDLVGSEVTDRLEKLGATVHIGHKASWVKNVDVVIYSSAVRGENVELQAAIEQNIPNIPRAELLAELMRMKTGIAISGSHGKTTVTSLVGEIITAGNLDPTVIVGGRLSKLGGGVRSGRGEILIAEADEYDKSFLRLAPVMVLINNIDRDHLECYGSFEKLEDAFVQFANNTPFYGRVVVCLDEPSLHPILPRIKRNVVSYGFSPQADVQAVSAEYKGMNSTFSVEIESKVLGEITLPLPGRYNILNALGAIAIAQELGVSFKNIKSALEGFGGVHRRFEIIGDENDIMLVSDFGHHPTAVTAVIDVAKTAWNRRVIVVFQAHLYSRTAVLAEQFGQSLLGADTAIVLPIYPAREDPIEGVTGKLISDAARKFGHKSVIYVEEIEKVRDVVCEIAKPGDMVMVIGAGSVDQILPSILEGLKEL